MTILILLALVAACSAPAPDARPAEVNENPLQGTVLRDQGEALKRAREVEAAIQEADQQRRAELDAIE